jgi:hypothetical protein
LRQVNRKTLLTGSLTGAILVAWMFSLGFFSAQAQAFISFTPKDAFIIPENNSTINFATDGTYSEATLQNGTWNFMNLQLNNPDNNSGLANFKASAQDSSVTIASCQNFIGTVTAGIRLRYSVVGYGTQVFNFGVILKGGEWTVSFNGDFVTENVGWRSSPDGTVTVTGATANVSISYYIVPSELGGNMDTSNQTFYQKHSVAIVTAVSVALVFILAVAIRVNNVRRRDRRLVL